MPEIEAVVVAFQGTYSQISNISKYVYLWIEKNGYRLSGKAFNISAKQAIKSRCVPLSTDFNKVPAIFMSGSR
jgi:hypothetical protein